MGFLSKYVILTLIAHHLTPPPPFFGKKIGFVLPVPFWYLSRRFPAVGYKYVNTPMILIGMTIVPGSASSWITVSFVIVLISQFYIKRRYTAWFVKYNYLISTALDSGTSLMVFIIAMALYGGASGISYPFPSWWGNRTGNVAVYRPNINILMCVIDLKYIDQCCANCT